MNQCYVTTIYDCNKEYFSIEKCSLGFALFLDTKNIVYANIIIGERTYKVRSIYEFGYHFFDFIPKEYNLLNGKGIISIVDSVGDFVTFNIGGNCKPVCFIEFTIDSTCNENKSYVLFNKNCKPASTCIFKLPLKVCTFKVKIHSCNWNIKNKDMIKVSVDNESFEVLSEPTIIGGDGSIIPNPDFVAELEAIGYGLTVDYIIVNGNVSDVNISSTTSSTIDIWAGCQLVEKTCI